MPTIRKKEIKEKPVKYKHSDRSPDFYSSMAWRRLRDTFISLHPLCQCCLEHDRVEPATQCHHIIPFLRGGSEEERWELFLDEKNLMPLCDKCHTALHVKDREYNMGRIDSLTDREYEFAHGLNYK